MQDKSIKDQTFFDPYISLQGNSSHANRMPTVHELKTASGLSVFKSISTTTSTADKLASIKKLSEFLDVVDALDKSQDKANLLWEMALAIDVRFHHFAVEDVGVVSEQMSKMLLQFFKATKDGQDDGILQKKLIIVGSLCDKACRDYEKHAPGSQNVPNARAINILNLLEEVDPQLFTMPQILDALDRVKTTTRPEGNANLYGHFARDAKL